VVPVFFLDRTSAGAIEIRSGSQLGGIVATLDFYQDPPQALAPMVSKGLLTRLIEAVTDFGDPALGDQTQIYAQSESITEAKSLSVITQHVVNGIAYVVVARRHEVTHSASVTYQYFSFQGEQGQEFGPVGPAITTSRSAVLDVVFDLAVYAVDLESAQVSASSSLLYTYTTTAVGIGTFYAVVRTATSTAYATPHVLSSLLPEQHPFKTCGGNLWSLQPMAEASVTTSGQNLTLRLFNSFVVEVSRSFNGLLGLNTASTRRMIARGLFVAPIDRVLELSSYANSSGSVCALYEQIDQPWTDSYAAYEPSRLLDRDLLFSDLSGLSVNDLELFLSTDFEPPALVLPGAATAGTTQDASYFMETDKTAQLTFAVGVSTALRYWIVD
jgi:hypothetical protein